MNQISPDQLVFEVGILYLRSVIAERERDALKKQLEQAAKPASDVVEMPNPNPNP